jgi:hypothetical protein
VDPGGVQDDRDRRCPARRRAVGQAARDRLAGLPPVVVATELPENEGASITNAAEELAADVLAGYLPERAGEERPFVWIEHYPPRPGGRDETFDLVTFEHYRLRQELRAGRWRMLLGEPVWRHLAREQVEALIGGALE